MNRRTALRWGGYVAFAVVFAIACAWLSHWQFDRNAGREEQLSLIATNYDADAVALDELIPPGDEYSPGLQWHPVTLVGEYLPDDTLLARNRAHGGTSAFEVLVPFRTDDGRVVVVDRGWIPPGADQALPDEIPAPPSGETTVVVRLKTGEPLPSSGRSAPEGQVPTINVPLIAEAIDAGDDVLAGAYGLLVSEDPAPAASPQPLEAPSDDPGPHLSYAIQWILFAVMGFVFIWYMIRTEIRHRREDAEDAATVAAGETPAPRVRTRRRRDRDAEEEDELVDAGR
ncbi:SURF1 family protein [Microbacterium telephonicum]|uniref:SURF1-like protein n=1 Tax=Microbacterium telephonicum TaxID=1714841 RepID=A0A498CB37_9MICO|nr:SURF1 family protein [Microbacterium telephonicum]RLK49578.1 cytochrome oxidase assembly protein ShyY1 [Microbacterium telephonicum]